MSRSLSRVGAFSAGHRRVVVAAWVVVAAVLALLAVSGATFSDKPFSIAGAESTTALATMQREFPERTDPDEGELLLVVQAVDGASVSDGASAALVRALVDRAQQVPHVLSATDPYDAQRPAVSADGTVAVSTLAVDLEADGVETDQARVEGFLGKSADHEELVAAVRAVASGAASLSAAATTAVVTHVARTAERAAARDQTAVDDVRRLAELTARERETVALVVRGLSNAEIAEHLFISTLTVKTHLNRSMRKMQVSDRASLVVAGMRAGILDRT